MIAVEVYQPLGGAQSWEELEAYFEAEEYAQATRRAVYEFERMSRNVLNDPEKSLTEKCGILLWSISRQRLWSRMVSSNAPAFAAEASRRCQNVCKLSRT